VPAKQKTPSSSAAPREAFLAVGYREGARIYTPSGFVVNGEIADPAAIDDLRARGETLVPYERSEPRISDEELQVRLALANERAAIARDLAKNEAEIRASLRKSNFAPSENGNPW